jgi:hypothetical protein
MSRALFGVDSTDTPRQLLRTGEAITIGSTQKVVASFDAIGNTSAPLGGRRAFTSGRTLAASVRFTDQSQAIITINVP